MKRIMEKRVIPAATIDSPEEAVRLAQALMDGGLDVLEITFRTESAAEAIARVSASCPQMLIGAGTLLTTDQVRKARAAGAQFGVAPGLNENVVRTAQQMNMPMIPGVVTPGEIERGVGLGCMLLKFFPAEPMGGVELLKALAGPYAHTGVKFVPTGGISGGNARAYVDLPIVAAVGGSWMVSSKLIKAGNWEEITRLSQEAVALLKRSGA